MHDLSSDLVSNLSANCIYTVAPSVSEFLHSVCVCTRVYVAHACGRESLIIGMTN